MKEKTSNKSSCFALTSIDWLCRPLAVLHGSAYEQLQRLSSESVNCVVTSPPYFNQRDYGNENQIGIESTFDEYKENLVAVFREVRRILRRDGTLWLNLGDKYQNKNLLLVPAQIALALQADGWILRQEIIWHKPATMPEFVSDRPTKDHETIFLLTKQPAGYFYDADAIREESAPSSLARAKYNGGKPSPKSIEGARRGVFCGAFSTAKAYGQGRNKRSVWTVATENRKTPHFAAMPEKLVKPCILAGCPKDGIVLDPFAGSGTTGSVALKHGRRAIMIELNKVYVEIIKQRCSNLQVKLFA